MSCEYCHGFSFILCQSCQVKDCDMCYGSGNSNLKLTNICVLCRGNGVKSSVDGLGRKIIVPCCCGNSNYKSYIKYLTCQHCFGQRKIPVRVFRPDKCHSCLNSGYIKCECSLKPVVKSNFARNLYILSLCASFMFPKSSLYTLIFIIQSIIFMITNKSTKSRLIVFFIGSLMLSRKNGLLMLSRKN